MPDLYESLRILGDELEQLRKADRIVASEAIPVLDRVIEEIEAEAEAILAPGRGVKRKAADMTPDRAVAVRLLRVAEPLRAARHILKSRLDY